MKRAPAADVLLEVGTEEIPARFLPAIRRQLAEGAQRHLGALLSQPKVRALATPRRLVLLVPGVLLRQPDQDETLTGPPPAQAFDPGGKPTPALEGFARKSGVAVKLLKELATDKGPRMGFTRTIKGKPAAAVLPGVIERIVGELAFPKSMRWPQSPATFARPIRWVLALHGQAPVRVTLGGVAAGTTTRGRRFVHPKPLPVRSPAEYLPVLKKAGILVDEGERKALIRKQADALAAKAGGKVLWDEDLLGEVSDLVEAPVAVMGSFPADALAVPQAVLVAAMQNHQRYFPVADRAGKLLPKFITIANGVHTPSVVAGNERVLKARLADARFFFETDRRKRLEDFMPALAGVVWQAGAGSMFDKARRMQALAAWLAVKVGQRNPAILQAALLAKADLVTSMVGEFPELQGVMGGVYAGLSGENEAVAAAIAGHYQPVGPKDDVPPTPEGGVVALADKLDHLAGHFVLGHAPTGTADPYALRRAGLGVIRIVFERGWRVPLRTALLRAGERHAGGKDEKALAPAAGQALAFLRGRMEGVFEEQGFAPDEIAAALVDFDDVVLAARRLAALAVLKARPGFKDTVVALSRVVNILPKGFAATDVDAAALEPAERALHDAHGAVRDAVAAHAAAAEFEPLYDRLASLKPAIDAFFAGVMVNDPDAGVRQRRLSLVADVARSVRLFADLKALKTV